MSQTGRGQAQGTTALLPEAISTWSPLPEFRSPPGMAWPRPTKTETSCCAIFPQANSR